MLTRSDLEIPPSDQKVERTVSCFLYLCELTDILTHLLPHVYALRSNTAQLDELSIDHLDGKVQNWYGNLPTWLTASWASRTDHIGGALSLCLCYQAILITLARLRLRQARTSISQDITNLAECQATASGVADLVDLLDGQSIRGFWLPYSAAHFTMATTVLLRCAIEYGSNDAGMLCLSKAKLILAKLGELRDLYGWDLGDDCLSQNSSLCARVEETLEGSTQSEVAMELDLTDYFDMPELTGFGVAGMDGLFWNDGSPTGLDNN